VILGSRVLFVHVPKTGGMAVTRYLLAALPRPVWYSHPDRDPTLDEGVVQVKGIRHETLAEAHAIAARLGIDAARLPLLIGVLRNPYALEVSRFAYLQKGHAWDAGVNQDLALAGDFTAFATQSTDHGGSERPIEAYFEIDGQRRVAMDHVGSGTHRWSCLARPGLRRVDGHWHRAGGQPAAVGAAGRDAAPAAQGAGRFKARGRSCRAHL